MPFRERTDLDEVQELCEKAAAAPVKDVEDENTSLKRGSRGNSKSPIASKQVKMAQHGRRGGTKVVAGSAHINKK